MKIVRENPDKPWNWGGLSWNPNITWRTVKENIDKPWNWNFLSENKFDRYNACVIIQRAMRRHIEFMNRHLEEIRMKGTEYYYAPDHGGYMEALEEFNKLRK